MKETILIFLIQFLVKVGPPILLGCCIYEIVKLQEAKRQYKLMPTEPVAKEIKKRRIKAIILGGCFVVIIGLYASILFMFASAMRGM